MAVTGLALVRPGHGTRTGYKNGCREECCVRVERAYQAEYHAGYRALTGRALIDASEAVERVRDYLARGRTLHSIAGALGVHHATLVHLMRRADRDRHPRARASTVRQILTARVPHQHTTIGAIRRVRALVRLGWTMQEIATRSGVHHDTIKALAHSRTTAANRSVLRAVTAVYDELSMTTPTPLDRWAKANTSRARNWATRMRWAPPLAWDDDTIDDPDARPTDPDKPARVGIDLDEVERLIEWGETPTAITARIDRRRDAIAQACRRANRPDLAVHFERADRNAA